MVGTFGNPIYHLLLYPTDTVLSELHPLREQPVSFQPGDMRGGIEAPRGHFPFR